MKLILFLLSSIIAFLMACAIGAQDVSHSFATSVGSKALTQRQVIILGSICEFSGSLFGGNVAGLFSSGIIDTTLFNTAEEVNRYGFIMFCTIAGAFSWLCIATKMSWPVSSTHSLVGSIVGLCIVYVNSSALNKTTLYQLSLSWFTSPVFGGIFAYIIQSIISKKIMVLKRPDIEAKKYMHLFTGFTVCILICFILMDGPQIIRCKFYVALPISLIMAYAVSRVYLMYYPRPKDDESDDGESQLSHEDMIEEAEKGFRPLMVLTACVVSFAHGTNDVSNAIGPFTAVAEIYLTGKVTKTPSPLWVLMYGGCGIIVGLYLFGHKVMHTIGDNIFKFTYSKGFSSQLATAITVLTATLVYNIIFNS